MKRTFKIDKKILISLTSIFFICYIPRMLMGFILTPYAVYDEGPALSSAAYLAGKDWSGITSISAYYGFGYYALFAPIFKLTDNPYTIYFVISEVNAIIQALYGVITFFIIHKFFKINKTIATIVISCICSYLTTVRPVVYNEVPLVFIVWIVAYILCSLVYYRNNQKKKIINSILLFATLAYSLTIHTRAVILLIGLVVVVLFYHAVYKEWLISLKTIPFGIVAVIIARRCINQVQNIIWNAGERISVTNTSIDLGLEKIHLLDPTTWRAMFLVIVGQVSTINLFSGGLFVISIYVLIKHIVVNRKNLTEDENRYYIMISLLFLLCCFGMIIGQGLSWMDGIYTNLMLNAVGNVYSYKAFSYIRYMGAFIGPFILCGMILINKKKCLFQKTDIIRVVILQLVIFLLWYYYVLPLLDDNSSALEAYVPFCFRKAHDAINIEQYKAALPWMLIIVAFIMNRFIFNDFRAYYVFVLGLLIFQVSYMAIYNDSYYGKERSSAASVCYEFVKELSTECKVSETIYSYGIDGQRLQFYLNNYQIEPVIPEEIFKDTILIYQGDLADLEGIDVEEWNYTPLGNNTYFLFQEDDYIEIIKSMGYEVM